MNALNAIVAKIKISIVLLFFKCYPKYYKLLLLQAFLPIFQPTYPTERVAE